MDTPFFASCDWGTSRFRLRLVDRATRRVIDSVETEDGVRTFSTPDEFSNFLLARLSELEERSSLAPCPEVWVSGMASSTIGWREVPYAGLPFPLDGSRCRTASITVDPGSERERLVHLVSGVASDTDVLRGEESQIIGVFADATREERASSLILLPGTHAKHARIERGAMTGFATFMTGELFEILLENSILRHSLTVSTEKLEREAFLEGLDHSVDGAPRHLFRVRTRAVLDGKTGGANRSFLSGLLIGDELRTSPWLRGDAPPIVLLVATGAIAEVYDLALEHLAIPQRKIAAPESLVCRGHGILRDAQKSK